MFPEVAALSQAVGLMGGGGGGGEGGGRGIITSVIVAAGGHNCVKQNSEFKRMEKKKIVLEHDLLCTL